jgi:E3 ubiquitin-protein ligase MYCBP2
MKCKTCNEIVSEETKKMILGAHEYETLEQRFLFGVIGSVIDCPQCKEKILFEKGGVDYNIKNDKNEKLSKETAEHYAYNRCRCPSCKIDFCVGCKSNPYHIGKTCENHLKFVSAKKCRYDDQVISMNNKGPADDVCNNQECVNTFKTACNKLLKCGHKCWGCKGEKVCPPCIDKECSQYVNIFDQNSDSYCNICFCEGLGNSPVVLMGCNHFIHYKCLSTRLSKKWTGPKITFSHCLCPQCNNWVSSPNVAELQEIIKENTALYEEICKKALERLKFDGLYKDPKLTEPNSKWYKKDLEYALMRLSYYMCFQCKKPYFAGLRECGDGPNVNNNQDREYDPKDLICGAHVNNYGAAGITECKTHGKDYIEYKCKFCCNIASWFCWGTTHFCENCHARQCKGDYVNKYTKDKLPKCDTSKCPVKVKHPENGEEFGLGCSVCRNNNENIKNF